MLEKTKEAKQSVGPKDYKAKIGNCICTKFSEKDNLSCKVKVVVGEGEISTTDGGGGDPHVGSGCVSGG